MKIGVLYICTGKYDIFWKDFYISCEKYLLKNYEKYYFVFTDSENIYKSSNNKNIHVFKQKNLGWPDNTLMRFHIFLTQKEKLLKMDYLFFFNANLEIKTKIGKEILPNSEGLVLFQHPGFYNKSNRNFTYERDQKSTAYIKKGDGKHYVQGALNGGTTLPYLKMCEDLSKNIDIDKSKGIIALWHDESQLNKYILDKKYKLMSPSYLYPEGWNIPFDCKILIRNKSKWIDIHGIKGHTKYSLANIFLLPFIKIRGLLKK